MTGPERRRSWSEEQKRAIVSAAFAPGAIVDVITITDIGDHLRLEWPITITGTRTYRSNMSARR